MNVPIDKAAPASRPSMGPNEIRDYNWRTKGQILTEIAAQLAEINYNLKIIADAAYADGMAKYGS